jgi:dolichol-phosphate mannosyltransferase
MSGSNIREALGKVTRWGIEGRFARTGTTHTHDRA